MVSVCLTSSQLSYCCLLVLFGEGIMQGMRSLASGACITAVFPRLFFFQLIYGGVKQVRSMSRTQKSSLFFFPTDLTITPKESPPRVTELFLFFVPYIYLLPVLNNKMCSHCGLTDCFVCKMSKSLFSDVQTPPKSQRFWIYSGVVQSSFIQHNFKIFHSH